MVSLELRKSRRAAAITVAKRVAEERGTELGDEVDYCSEASR